jgi:uncharacterized membrane protein
MGSVMKSAQALKYILGLSVAGLLFSGYLSYNELFASGCEDALIKCGTKSFDILGLPACVYGFFMYLVIFILSYLGTRSRKAK